MKRQIARNVFQRRNSFYCSTSSVRATATATASSGQVDPGLATAKPLDSMPKVPTWPILGSAWIYMPIIGKYSLNKQHLADRDKHQKYGDVVREKFGHLNIVSSFNPDDMLTVYKNEGQYPTRGELTTLKAYRESRKDWYKTGGVVVLDGKEWWDLRSKVQRHLMKPKAIESYLEPMQEVARDLVKKIYAEKDQNKEVPHFMEQLYKWALESVAYVGLDTRLGCLDKNLPPDSDGLQTIHSVQTMLDCMNKLEAFTGNVQWWKYFPTPTWKKFCNANDVFTKIAFKYINRSMEALKNRKSDAEITLLQNMLLTKDLDTSGAMVTVADMLFAGIDSTSHTVAFLLYHLAKNPDKQQILFEDLKRLLPNKNDRITPEVFAKLRYLKCCMKESIRVDPIVRGNARVLARDAVISGYHVPKGTIVFVLLQEIYRDERYFKNADQYLPERWLHKEDKPKNPFSYVPFGIGTRSCIGRRLAELEILCLATEILRNFKVEYHHEDFGMLTRLVNIPDKPLRYNFIER